MGFFSKVKKIFTGSEGKQPELLHAATANVGDIADIAVAQKEDEALIRSLREAEPRLSAWLVPVLAGLEEAGPLLWHRLRVLLLALETPQEEAEVFLQDFAAWQARMGYDKVVDFRSELQYRLALALDLEDEEDERDLLFLKLKSGLEATRESLGKGLHVLFAQHGELDAEFWDELEELFIRSDMGAQTAGSLTATLRHRAQVEGLTKTEQLSPVLEEEITRIFQTPRRVSVVTGPEIVLMVGINGVGKTTTIAKLAYRAKAQGKRVLIAGADTFRAAAVEQLEMWATRLGIDFHAKASGADPASVAYEAMEIALGEKPLVWKQESPQQPGMYDMVFIDTAGRLHTKTNLMEELHKIRNVLGKKLAGAPHRTILVIDATTGQNALQQTKMFTESSGVNEIVLTKMDGTAKGGVALAVAEHFKTPITYIGLGEKMEDLRPFVPADFAKALLA